MKYGSDVVKHVKTYGLIDEIHNFKALQELYSKNGIKKSPLEKGLCQVGFKFGPDNTQVAFLGSVLALGNLHLLVD